MSEVNDVTKSAVADWCMLVWGGLALAVYVLFSVCLCFRTNWRQLCSDVRSWKQNLQNQVHDGGNLASKVSGLVEERHRQSARLVAMVGSPPLAFSLYLLMHIKMFVDWNSSNTNNSISLVSGHMTLPILALMVTVVCMVNRDMPIFSVRSAISCMILAGLAATALLYETVLQLVFDRIYVFIGRLVATVVFGSFRSSLLLNAIYSIIVCSVWTSFAMKDQHVDSFFGPDPILWFIIQEMVSFVALCALSSMNDNRTQSEAKATIEARASRAFHTAIQMLLRTIYDLVIQLDQDLKLVEDAEALGGLLLHGSNRSLKGASLLDYMYGEEDKELFQAHLNQMPAGELQSMAIPLRLRLRDSSGRPLYVELLHSTFKDIDAQTHHIIGIQEIEQNTAAPQELIDLHSRSTGGRHDRRRRSLERGTPPNGRAEELTGTLLNMSRTPSRSHLAMSRYKETQHQMLTFSLFALLLKWDLQVPSTFCGNYHFYVYQAQCTLRRLHRTPCVNNPFNEMCAADMGDEESDWQCTRCGMLGAKAQPDEDAGNPGCLWCADMELGATPQKSPTEKSCISL
ncbi:unnamed protein product [Polarella glacialis]|uniref:PAS domain-containing protein n=1 Tax=Polarella glacialis TaxID=89957 RepID=A0A813EJV3_POLGL|nr:unnamed protein product [Polarella glacialis]